MCEQLALTGFLALNRTPTQLEALSIHTYCPNITGCAQKEDFTQMYKSWNGPDEVPDKDATMKMLKEAVGVAVNVTIKNHIILCKFNRGGKGKVGPEA